MKKIEISGKKIGQIYVKESLGGYPVRYLCVCPCGDEFAARSQNIRTERIDCGCGVVSGNRKKKFNPGDIYKGCTILEVFKKYDGGQTCYKYTCSCGQVVERVHANFLEQPLCHDCFMENYYSDKANALEGTVINGFKIIKYTGAKYTTKDKDERHKASYVIVKCPECGEEFETAVSRLKKGIQSCGKCNAENLKSGYEIMKIARAEGTNLTAIQEGRKINKNNFTGHTGISMYKGRYRAYITFKRKQYHLGLFSDLEDAIKARKFAEEKIYGNFLEWYAETYPENWEKLQRKSKT